VSGPPVVLVHGLYGTLDDPALIAQLDAAETLSPDLLGYGSQAARPAMTLEEQADHVAAAAASLAQPVVLVGHSLGGAVALLVAERHPQQVTGLVSIEGNMAPADAFFSGALAESTPAAVAEQLSAAQGDPEAWLRDADLPPTPARVALAREWLARQGAAALQAAARTVVEATFAPDWSDRLSAVLRTTPYALLAGERSAPAWAVPEAVRRGARGSEVVAGTGHFLPTEAPAEVGAALRRLIARL
jgi:lipase